MAQENEREYLVQSGAWRQDYLSTDPERSARVRAGSDKAFITIKGGSGSGKRLDRAQFETANGHKPKRLPSSVGDLSAGSRHQNANLAEHPSSKWPRTRSPEAKYHWKADESVPEGLQRIVSEQLQCAIWHLSGNGDSLDEAVHEARKSLKKSRSAMRLLQRALRQEYARENVVLRDAGRKLSPLRDAQALIEVFDELNVKYRDKLGDVSLVSVRDGLVARKKQLARDFQRKRVRSAVLKNLRESAGRVEKWDLATVEFAALSRGFARTIRRNRKAWSAATTDAAPDTFHEWRKRAKDLRYHFGLVAKAWPPVLEGYEDASKELESKLGDDHNLVVLRNTILENPHRFGKEKEMKAFLDIIDAHQQKLRAEAKTLAERFNIDKPKRWRRNLDRYWGVWKKEAAGA